MKKFLRVLKEQSGNYISSSLFVFTNSGLIERLIMTAERAANYFHGPERYNCGQAVLKAFQDEHNISESEIEQFRGLGGGKADGGMCGALFAAKSLVGADKQDELEAIFVDKAGSWKCREIRRSGSLSCRECVYTAAKLLKEMKES